jgi:galactose oxidase
VGRPSSISRVGVALLVAAGAGCQDTVRPGSLEAPLGQITVTYLCGNDFTLRNEGPLAMTVHYAVIGTTEEGDLILPARSESAAGTTRLTTLQWGPLQISAGDDPAPSVDNLSTSCPPPAPTYEPQATVGQWTPPFAWPVVAVHLHLLPSGRVLSWGRLGSPQIYDPASGAFSEVSSSTMVFCSGHTFLPDGRLLVSGGHLDDRRGLPDANIFDGGTPGWLPIPQMRYARWYPTNTTLPNGEILALAGTDQAGEEVEIPEVWTGSSWRSLPGAARPLPYYPRTFVAPNGLVFYAGELQQTAYLDPSGPGTWIPVAGSKYGRRDYGSAVMYGPGKVMILGGSDPPDGKPTSTAELIDLNDPSPSWRYTEPMTHARRHLNATMLPDGQVLVTGGTSSAGFSDRSGAVHAAEMWNPATERWTMLTGNQVSRVYHSTTLLLPDGRVLHAGSGDGPGLPRELSAELFLPPYLFKGPRPVIDDAPAAVGYGQSFFLATPDATQVLRVTLVRLPSVTHAFDQSQRFIELDFRRTAGGLTVRAPASNLVAPPGPHLLTVLNSVGVPSVARIIRVQ